MGKHHWPVDRAAQVLGALPLLGLVGSVGTVSLALTSGTSVDSATSVDGGGAVGSRESLSTAAPGPRLPASAVAVPAGPRLGHPGSGDPLLSTGLTPPSGVGLLRTPSSSDDEFGPAGHRRGPDTRPSAAAEPRLRHAVTRGPTESPRQPPQTAVAAVTDTSRSLDRAATNPSPDADDSGGTANDGGVSSSSAGLDTHRLPSRQGSTAEVEDDDPPIAGVPTERGPSRGSLLSTGTMLSFGSTTVSVL